MNFTLRERKLLERF